MREIKFRAWDKELKFMRLGDDIEEDESIKTGLSYGKFYIAQETPSGDWDELIVMQYTGFKDKNGKEIYEGDSLMFDDTESVYVDVGIGSVKVAETAVNAFFPIEFWRGEFGMTVKNTEHGIEGWISLRTFQEDFFAMNTCEVIGNIYDNPELLN